MIVKQASGPILGFDVNQQLSELQAKGFADAGNSFCMRYLPRTAALTKGNLTNAEIQAILAGGLALGAVQHVEKDNWMPTAELGAEYGSYAGQYAKSIGLPLGVCIFLDLEMVSATSNPNDIIEYCTQWFSAVHVAGYVPGLYVGWQTGLTPQQLYNLPFTHYWKGYNADISIPTRGYQIIQETEKTLNGIVYDPNKVQADNLGDSPIFLFPS